MRSKSLLGRAPQPPAARNRCSSVPRSLLAFEITARARFFVFSNTRKRRPSVSARSRGSSKRRWIRQRFRVSCGIPFEIPFGIALLRTLHCFELCFARLHRHRQVPYANLFIYIYIYIYSYLVIRRNAIGSIMGAAPRPRATDHASPWSAMVGGTPRPAPVIGPAVRKDSTIMAMFG